MRSGIQLYLIPLDGGNLYVQAGSDTTRTLALENGQTRVFRTSSSADVYLSIGMGPLEQ